MLDCKQKKLRMPLSHQLRDLKGFARLTWRMGIRAPYRWTFWRTLAKLVWRNPRGLRYSVALIALYLHFGQFRSYLLSQLDPTIQQAERARRDATGGAAAAPVAG